MSAARCCLTKTPGAADAGYTLLLAATSMRRLRCTQDQDERAPGCDRLAATNAGMIIAPHQRRRRVSRSRYQSFQERHVFNNNARWFPINKNLWTSSYVLLAAGWSLLAFALCYWAVEGRSLQQRWTKAPLVFGMNTITAYVFSELLGSALYSIPIASKTLQQVLYHRLFGFIHPLEVASLLYSIAFVGVCWIPVYVLYRSRIFIKI